MESLKMRAALTLFKQLHEKYPGTLDELVPGILSQVPLDPFTGQRFQYTHNATAWQLRSAGPDTIFDNKEPTFRQLRGNFWEGTRHVFVWDPDSESGQSSKRVDFDYIFVSTLDSNANAYKKDSPRALAEWFKLHPEQKETMAEPSSRPTISPRQQINQRTNDGILQKPQNNVPRRIAPTRADYDDG